jgi:phytoene desaturase
MKVAVIGAGIGGLAAALRLRVLGYDVAVYEKNERVGGRCNLLEDGGYRFDVGPSLLLMPDVFRELFAFAGADFDERVTLVKMEPNYRATFADGTTLDVSSDLARMVPQLEAIEPGVAGRYYAFLADARRKYRHGRHEFVEKNFLKASDFFTPRNLRLLGTLGATQKLYAHVARFFRDERLRQVFSMQSMYLGISPSRRPRSTRSFPTPSWPRTGSGFPTAGSTRCRGRWSGWRGSSGSRSTPTRRSSGSPSRTVARPES